MRELDIWLSFVLGADCGNGDDIVTANIPLEKLYENRTNWKIFGCFNNTQIEKASRITLDDVKDICEKHSKENIESINYTDEIYPDKFKNISHPPIILFYKGDIEILSKPYIVAVIGSRKCKAEGEMACKLIAKDIAANDGVVVSGMAQGIDSIANKTCIENGGKTIGVSGAPLDIYYPKSNKKLQKSIEENHLVLSEYYSGTNCYPFNFVQRNRIIAAISDAVCVVQAKKDSGSMKTADCAIEYDRKLFAVPGSIFDEMYEGTNELLADEKAVRIVDGIQIMKHLDAKTEERKVPEVKLSPELQLIYDSIEGATRTGDIIRKCQMSANAVKAGLTQLEMDGYVIKARTGEYVHNK